MSTRPEPAPWGFTDGLPPRGFAREDSAKAVRALEDGVRELTRAAREDKARAGAGAVELIERIDVAVACVDGSSGALPRAIRRALDAAIELLIAADVDEARHDAWLARLGARFTGRAQAERALERVGQSLAYETGHVHERLGERWGELCKTRARADAWAQRLTAAVRLAWIEGAPAPGALACLSSLLAAGQHEALFSLLELRTIATWPERQFGVRALAAAGRLDEAIAYAQHSNPLGHRRELDIARTCEELLLAAGERGRAYAEFAAAANTRQNCLQTFKALCARYPEHEPGTILADLIAHKPGEEGKWFATARTLRFFELAAEIAARAPCDPKTLNRAARERLEVDPSYALELSLASLRWIIEGHGVEIGAADVLRAHGLATRAGMLLGGGSRLMARIRAEIRGLCELPAPAAGWVRELLADELE